MFELNLLGPVTLRRDGRELAVTVKKSQALLLLLALGGRHGRERVTALLWPTLDVTRSRRNLRRELARLRESGADGFVHADGDMLALADAVVCDARTFADAVRRGEPEAALMHWHGEPGTDLRLDADDGTFHDWLAAQRKPLLDLRQQALTAAAALHEAAGAWQPAIVHLNSLLADDPLQERHHRAMIRVLQAAGRREDALAQYQRCRELLAAELGLQPMAETEALVGTLRSTPLQQAQQPQQPQQPQQAHGPQRRTGLSRLPAVLPFVGRQAEVSALEAAWLHGRVLLIEGEAGVGKSRLAQDFCAARGAYALARCRPGDAAVPYAAFTRALRVLAADALAAAGLPEWVGSELARVLPELGRAPSPATPLQAVKPNASAEERTRFFEACAQAWQALADGNFDAVLLDDWHLSDAPSQALLAFIAQRLGPDSARLLLLTRPASTMSAAAALAEGAHLHLVLTPLPAAPVLALVRQLSGVAAPTLFAQRLQRATGGNPYFMAETLRHLIEAGEVQFDAEGRWSTPYDQVTQDYRELPLPASVRDAVLARVQRLPEAARRLLEAASLAREPFAPALLAAACALSELEALTAIEQALAAALLREHESGGYAFAHDLAQQALEGALAADRRRLVHRRLALAAQATQAAAGLTALHFEAGGEPARAVAYRLAAGDEAQALFAGEQALQHWQAALALGATPTQAAALHLRSARALIDLGDGTGALAQVALLDALVASGGLADSERIAAITACAEIEATLNKSRLALSRIEALLASLPQGQPGPAGPAGPARARALGVHSQALQLLGRLDEAQTAAQAALALWRDDQPLERAGLLDQLQAIEYQRGQPQKALVLARQSAALFALHGDRRSIARGHHRIGTLLLVSGDADGGAVELKRARQMAAEMRLVEQERDSIINILKVHADRGEARQMLVLADEGWNLSPTFARPRIRQILLQARAHACNLLGDLGQCLVLAEQFLAESAAVGEPVGRQYAVLTLLEFLVYLGEFDRCRALLQELAQADTAQLAYLGVKLGFGHTFLELRAGNTGAARNALEALGDPALLAQPQDRASHAMRLADLLLAEGDAAGALAALEPWRDDAVPNMDLLAAIWTLRLQAQHHAGASVRADWQQALAALDQPLPAPEALDLRRALLLAAPTEADAAALRAACHQAAQAMCASLAGWPRQQAHFKRQMGL